MPAMNATDLTPSATIPPPRSPHRPKKTAAPMPLPAMPEMGKPGDSSKVSDQTRTIIAQVDVGWGNSVYMRGEGGGLSWGAGVPMFCAGDDRWVWCCHADQAPKQFKFLRNDQDWALGENEVMSGAEIIVCSPKFP